MFLFRLLTLSSEPRIPFAFQTLCAKPGFVTWILTWVTVCWSVVVGIVWNLNIEVGVETLFLWPGCLVAVMVFLQSWTTLKPDQRELQRWFDAYTYQPFFILPWNVEPHSQYRTSQYCALVYSSRSNMVATARKRNRYRPGALGTTLLKVTTSQFARLE